MRIPDGVTQLKSCFQGTNISSLHINKKITSGGISGWFGGEVSSNLESIIVDPDNTAYKSIDGILYNKSVTSLLYYPAKKSGTEFTIPSTITSIGSRAFANNNYLVTITIPSSVTSIGCWAFSGYSIANINFEANKSWTGYYWADNSKTISISSTEIDTPTKAATCLKSTYNNYTWK